MFLLLRIESLLIEIEAAWLREIVVCGEVKSILSSGRFAGIGEAAYWFVNKADLLFSRATLLRLLSELS